ncbi:MAG: transferrin-binding protein-like solute binding protein, partial [Rhodobacter sp.]|nr:transferrin-binding protein-like solute binding protein [Rhodobacter sp.]
RFRDGTGDTYGAWGEWSYAYTASDRVERGRSDNTRTLRHGTATGSGGCARADYGCTAFYALANHGGLLYGGTPDGTATYEGQTWASVLRASADTQDDYVIAGNSLFAGDATLTANFDRSSVNARFHSFNGSEPELRGGITFSGIPLITSDGQFRQGRNGTSDRFIDGAFFGPDGTEAAGTWYVDSTTPTRRSCGAGGGNLCNQGSIVVGSFAAKQQQ